MSTKPTSRAPLASPVDDDAVGGTLITRNRFSAADDYEDGPESEEDSLLAKAAIASLMAPPSAPALDVGEEEEVEAGPEAEAKFYINAQTGEVIEVTKQNEADPEFMADLSRRGFVAVSPDVDAAHGEDGHDHHDDGPVGRIPGITYRHDGRGLTLDRPVDDDVRVSDTFRVRDRHPVTGRHAAHRGIDIATGTGMSIEASAEGQVAYAGWSNGYGNVVIVYHGAGVFTMQAHLSRLDVRTGQNVSDGQRLGLSGNTGIGTGAHLHTEVWLSDSRGGIHAIDPRQAWAGADLSDPATRAALIARAERTLNNSEEATAFGRVRSISRGAIAADVRELAAPAPALT